MRVCAVYSPKCDLHSNRTGSVTESIKPANLLPKERKKFKEIVGKVEKGLQGGDLNPRPPGYEPDELPGCSTLRQEL